MNTTTITVTGDSGQVTLVNVFTVAPERQDDLVAALDKATGAVFVTVPGFLSANLHASLDGTRVINYAQWSSEQAYLDALRRPEIRDHVGEAAALADKWDPTLVRVRAIHHRREARA
jgi:heme-degrading monooxygenase HmoA